MALMTELVESEPSSFEEAVEQLIRVDAMVEEYESIVKNSFWEVIPRLADKSVVVQHGSSRLSMQETKA